MTSLNTVWYDTRFNVTPHVFSSLNMGTKVVKLVPNGLFEKEREREDNNRSYSWLFFFTCL